jgi:hypothetical protein
MQDPGYGGLELSERSDTLLRPGSASRHYVTPLDRYTGIWIQESFLVVRPFGSKSSPIGEIGRSKLAPVLSARELSLWFSLASPPLGIVAE